MDRYIAIAIVVGLLIAGTALAQLSLEPAVSEDDRIESPRLVAEKRDVHDYEISESKHRKFSWRFCHDGARLVVVPFWSCGETQTRYELSEYPTLAGATNQIARMHLRVTESQAAAMAELEPIRTVTEITVGDAAP